jgi:HK97 family phage prohead protease
VAKYDAAALKKMAANGQAMPDGSYPIADGEDLHNAIHAVGRGGGSHNAIRKHIMARAKTLGMSQMIPDNWKADGSIVGANSARAALLSGSRERRRHVAECEIRSTSSGLLHFEGVFVRFDDPYEVTDRFGTFTETVDPRALQRSLNLTPDVVLNVNHAGLPLARTISATLELSTNEKAGIARADLEPRDPDVQQIQYKIERGDLPDMSWAFRAIRDVWNEDETDRRLMETSIDGGDVSIVTTGANRNTHAGFRSAISSLVDMESLLVEARSTEDIDLESLKVARGNLDRLIAELNPRKTYSVKQALREIALSS